MSLKNQITAWVVLLGIFGLLLWMFRGILLPFVLGITLAYLLNPFVDWLQRRRVHRGFATLVVMLVAVLLLITAFLLIVPLLCSRPLAWLGIFPAMSSNCRVLSKISSRVSNNGWARTACWSSNVGWSRCSPMESGC